MGAVTALLYSQKNPSVAGMVRACSLPYISLPARYLPAFLFGSPAVISACAAAAQGVRSCRLCWSPFTVALPMLPMPP